MSASGDRDRVTSVSTVALRAAGFDALSRRERVAAWHLGLAACAGQEITFDQLGWDTVPLVRVLEGIVAAGPARPEAGSTAARIAGYLVDVHAHGGLHHAYAGHKRIPPFSPDELDVAARAARAAGAVLPALSDGAFERLSARLAAALFDPDRDPRRTGDPGDPLSGSAVTFYERGLTSADLDRLDERYPLTSRVVRGERGPIEVVYRAGGAGAPPGLYAPALARVCAHLERAAACLDGAAAASLRALVRALSTGETADLEAHRVAWLEVDAGVDAVIGFCDTYADPRSRKGLWDALIYCRAPAADAVLGFLAARAQDFEDRMPWPDRFKRSRAVPASAAAHDLLWCTALPPVGLNLPDEQHLRQRHGARSLLLTNAFAANQAGAERPLLVELSPPEDRAAADRHGDDAWRLLVAIHEVLGHASGRLDDGVPDPSVSLGEHADAIEEARADLVALWHAFDPSLAAVVPDHGEVARQLYRSYLVDSLANLRWQEEGDRLTGDHVRAHQLVVETMIAAGAAERIGSPGRRSIRVASFEGMRRAAGALLGELMEIRAAGDRARAGHLLEERGARFDPALRDEVIARARSIGVPGLLYKASPRMRPILDGEGGVVDAELDPEASGRADLVEQALERSLLGRLPPGDVARVAATLGRPGAAAAALVAATARLPDGPDGPIAA